MNLIDAVIEKVRQGCEEWALTPLEHRIAVLNSFKQVLSDGTEELALTISQETGKPLWEARQEVQSMIHKIPLTIQAYRERNAVTELQVSQGKSYTRFKPYGVVAVLGPFNFPGHLPNGHIAPALLAGNGVIFKPSEYTPRTGELSRKYWIKGGLPENVFEVLQGGREIGSSLVNHPGIDGIFFTGSFETGKIFAEHFSKETGKILALEMGGNNPLLVSSVQDLQAASLVAIQSSFLSAGQRCSCARRLIVLEGDNGDRFLEVLVETAKKIRVGKYTDVPEPFMGPVISLAAAEKILNSTAALREKGGIDLLPLKQVDPNSPLLTPGIMDVTACQERPDEEIFGPFLQVIRVKDFNEGIKEANRTRFGLTAGLLSDKEEEYEQFYRKVKAGVINWNLPLTGASSANPFGGTGCSGNNRPSGYFAVDYCSYPVASLENPLLSAPKNLIGIDL